MANIEKLFPDYFSKKAINLILANGKNEELHVYRVNKYGDNKKIAFLNYYEEVMQGYKIVRNTNKYLSCCKDDIDRLSVSCYYDKADIMFYFEVTLKETYPRRTLLEGITKNKFGLAQKTTERKKEVKDSHVDWWIFKDGTPWEVFEEV